MLEVEIFCQTAKLLTIRRNNSLYHLINHCLLTEQNETLPQNNDLFDTVGQLLTTYSDDGSGQYGIEGNAAFNKDELFWEWNDSLLSALFHLPMQFLEITEDIYLEKLGDLPPLMLKCTIHNSQHSCYQIPLNYITGEGNFIGGYSNSQGFWLIGIPEDTLVLSDQGKPRSSQSDGWTKAKTILEIYQN